jgi:hypothetical protein
MNLSYRRGVPYERTRANEVCIVSRSGTPSRHLRAFLSTAKPITLESLLPELFLGRNAAENTVDELVRMGIVDVGPDGALTLTQAGKERNHALLARARSIEARELSDIPQSEIASCRRVLSRLVERTQTV